MQYDPIKRSLGNVFNKSPFLRKMFYRLLDLLLLRSWHVKKEIREWNRKRILTQNILDAGAGFGQYSYFISMLSPEFHITAVDVKEEQVADCNNFFKSIGKEKQVRFFVDDLTKYKKENFFDLVVCVDVMEHILEDSMVFKNYYDSMKPGALLIISTPSDQGGSDVHGADEHSFIEEHVRDGYNIHDIEKKLSAAGFSKIEAKYSYGMPGKISWRLSMKYPILMLGMSKLFFILLPFYYLLVYPLCYILNYLDVTGTHSTGTGLIVKAWK